MKIKFYPIILIVLALGACEKDEIPIDPPQPGDLMAGPLGDGLEG